MGLAWKLHVQLFWSPRPAEWLGGISGINYEQLLLCTVALLRIWDYTSQTGLAEAGFYTVHI